MTTVADDPINPEILSRAELHKRLLNLKCDCGYPILDPDREFVWKPKLLRWEFRCPLCRRGFAIENMPDTVQ